MNTDAAIRFGLVDCQRYVGHFLFSAVLSLCSVHAGAANSDADMAASVITKIDELWSTTRFRERESVVQAFTLPLGAMKKRQGVWRLESFEPLSGRMQRLTWSVAGVSVLELYADVANYLAERTTPLWDCEARSCGNASEWASRIYQERLLYGRDEYMRYGAYRSDSGTWFTLFSAARTADRQYLHLDIVRPEVEGE